MFGLLYSLEKIRTLYELNLSSCSLHIDLHESFTVGSHLIGCKTKDYYDVPIKIDSSTFTWQSWNTILSSVPFVSC